MRVYLRWCELVAHTFFLQMYKYELQARTSKLYLDSKYNLLVPGTGS